MNHRDVPRAGHVLPVALLVAGAFYRPGYGQTGAGVASENPRAQVNRVLLALPQIAFPATGRGTALVMWDTAADKPADRPRFVEFAFKGPMSRADVFEFLGGRKGPWLYSHAITDRFHFGVNAGGVRISYHPRHNQLGEDFHPAVFLSYPEPGEGPLDERLRRYLNSEGDLAAEVDAEGILQLVHRWDNEDVNHPYDTAVRLSFDTHRGYLPVLLSRDSNYRVAIEKSWHWTVKFDWIRYGSAWYVSSAERVSYTGDLPDAARPSYITITAFDPNAEVSDEEFTMEALGAQEGMTVVDADSGFSHAYSPPAPIPAGWKETVEETEPTRNAPKQDSAPVPSIPDAANQQISSEPTAVTAPARVPLFGRTSTLAPPPASGATAGMRRSFSSGVELTADGGQQPDGPARPTAPPADKAHATEGDHLAASPHRVVRIHTLLGLFLLLSMFVVVEYANAHARARNRQPREL
jgi:hypothetical protein